MSILNYNLQGRWAWQPIFKTKVICVWHIETFMPNLISVAFILAKICALTQTSAQTKGYCSINSNVDAIIKAIEEAIGKKYASIMI